eukprot:11031678-Prorocentrum_lima.AAC.1
MATAQDTVLCFYPCSEMAPPTLLTIRTGHTLVYVHDRELAMAFLMEAKVAAPVETSSRTDTPGPKEDVVYLTQSAATQTECPSQPTTEILCSSTKTEST